MTIDPTREEWLAARERAVTENARGGGTHSIVGAALGVCPPEPVPEPFRLDAYTLVRIGSPYRNKIAVPRHLLTPDEAVAMSEALIEHAAFARKQSDDPWRSDEEAAALVDAIKSCGMLLDIQYAECEPRRCKRPEGHTNGCGPHRMAGDDDPELCGAKASSGSHPCVRPENHPGVCAPYRLARDDG